MDAEVKQTIGEKRVRVTFNPSNNGRVDLIKQKSAELINLLEELKVEEEKLPRMDQNSEKFRLIAKAQTEFENAAMWGVKAATTSV